MGEKRGVFLPGPGGTCLRWLMCSLWHLLCGTFHSHEALSPLLPPHSPAFTYCVSICPTPLLLLWPIHSHISAPAPWQASRISSQEKTRVSLCIPSRPACRVKEITNWTLWFKFNSHTFCVILKEMAASVQHTFPASQLKTNSF